MDPSKSRFKTTKSLLRSELAYEKATNLNLKADPNKKKKRPKQNQKNDDKNIFEDLLNKISSPLESSTKQLIGKLSIKPKVNKYFQPKTSKNPIRPEETFNSSKEIKQDAYNELSSAMREYVPSRLNTPPSTQRELIDEREQIQQKKLEYQNTRRPNLSASSLQLETLLQRNARSSLPNDQPAVYLNPVDQQIQEGDIENLISRYEEAPPNNDDKPLTSPVTMKIRSIKNFSKPSKNPKMLKSQEFLENNSSPKKKKLLKSRYSFLVKNYQPQTQRPSTATNSKQCLMSYDADYNMRTSTQFSINSPKQDLDFQSRYFSTITSDPVMYTEDNATTQFTPLNRTLKGLNGRKAANDGSFTPYSPKDDYNFSVVQSQKINNQFKDTATTNTVEQSNTMKSSTGMKMINLSQHRNSEPSILESFQHDELQRKNMGYLSSRMVEYEYFLQEFMPESIVENIDSEGGSKLPYIFFSSTRIFGLITELNQQYHSLATNLNDLHQDYNSTITISNSKIDSKAAQQLSKKYNNAIKQITLMQNTVLKMRKISKLHHLTPRKSFFKQSSNQLLLSLSSNRTNAVEAEKLINQLDLKLKELIEDYKMELENVIPNSSEIFQNKTLKLQNTVSQNKIINFLDIVHMKYEEIIQEQLKEVFIFYPNLKNFHSRVKRQFKNINTCLQNGWDQMLIDSLSFEDDLNSLAELNLCVIQIFDDLLQVQKTCCQFIVKSIEDLLTPHVKIKNPQKVNSFIIFSRKYADIDIFPQSQLSNTQIEKLTQKIAFLLNSLGSFKQISKIEEEYNQYIEDAEKLFQFAETKLIKLEEGGTNKKDIQQDLKDAIDIETQIIQTLTKITLCENHFSQEVQDFDATFKIDLVSSTVEILNGFIDKLEVNQNKYRKFIDNVCNRLRKEYEILVQDIKKQDIAFNTYVVNNITKKFSFLDFENAANHLASISNFAQIMQNHSDKLTASFKQFDMIRDVALQRTTLIQHQKSRKSNDMSFKPSQVGIILHPDYSKVRAIVENFEKKVRILDEFFLVEDQFCYKNLDQAFRSINFIAITGHLQHLYAILSQSVEKQRQLQRNLAKKENEFLIVFCKKVLSFEKLLLEFLQKVVDVTQKNKETYEDVVKQSTDYIPNNIEQFIKTLHRLKHVISSDYDDLINIQLVQYSSKNKLFQFFLEVLQQSVNEEQSMLKKIIYETQDAYNVCDNCMSELVNQFRNIACVLENFEKENAFSDFLDSIEGAISKKISSITQTNEQYSKNLTSDLGSCLRLTKEYLREQFREVRKARSLMEIHLDFTLTALRDKLSFSGHDEIQTFQELKHFIEVLTQRIDNFRQVKYASMTSLIDLSHNESHMDYIHKEFYVFIEYVLRFLNYIHQARESLMNDCETLYQGYVEGQQDFSTVLSKIAILYERWVKKTKEFLKNYESERTPFSCHHIFEKFWNTVIKEEAQVILRCAQDSQEFEKFIENLRQRFCNDIGEFKESEFLISNFNEEQAADHEEISFEANKFALKLREYLKVDLISSKKIFREELNKRKEELDKFIIFLEIFIVVNKEVIIVKERIRITLEDDTIVEKRVADAIRIITDIITYLQRVYKEIFHQVKRLKNTQVETFVDHHILSALKIALSYFNKISDSFVTLNAYYESRREKFAQSMIFLDSDFVNSLKRGQQMHKQSDFTYKRRPLRQSVQLESLDDIPIRKTNSPINVSKALYRKLTTAGKSNDKEFDFLINSVDMEQSFFNYGIMLQEEFAKNRSKFMGTVGDAIDLMNDMILRTEHALNNNQDYFEDDTLAIITKLKNILSGTDSKYDDGVNWSDFIEDLEMVENGFKEINSGMNVLKDVENLKKIEIVKYEELMALKNKMNKNNDLSQWQKWVTVFNSQIVPQYNYYKGVFHSETDFMDFLEVKVRVGEGTNKFYEDNTYLFGYVYRFYFQTSEYISSSR